MRKGITTNQLPPIPEHKTRPRRRLTTNKVQPKRSEIPKTRKGFGRIISTNNLEEIQAANRGEGSAPKRGRPKGKTK
jgi:hypothetical protein